MSTILTATYNGGGPRNQAGTIVSPPETNEMTIVIIVQ